MRTITPLLLFVLSSPVSAANLKAAIEPSIEAVEAKVIAWRHDIHQNPELSNREFRTSKLVAKHLKKLGLEVETGIAHTGVVGILRGGRPGKVVALRADMDALPVTEQTGLPFASKVTTEYKGAQTGVMHACGHDAHTAVLMGVAEVLAQHKAELPGTVKFIFQPSEEGAPEGEKGGAKLMIEEGVLDGEAAPEAIFGLHVWPREPGHVFVRPEAMMAASDRMKIIIQGKQTHGSQPWRGIDPITIAAQVITNLQLIASRQIDITKAPAVISIGSIHAGNRDNIIPNDVLMEGTLRTFDSEMREDIIARIKRTVQNIVEAAGTTATVDVISYAPVTWNDPATTERMRPTLEWAAGAEQVQSLPPVPGAEDFAYYLQKIPGMFVFLGVNKEGVAPNDAAPNHSPLFYVNDEALIVGVRALSGLAVDYLQEP